MQSRFLQLHWLTSFPGALLNRDDAGFAKRMPFGGATRTRISSQCLKRHWRTYEGEEAISRIELDGDRVPMAVRSRRSFERFVLEPLLKDHVNADVAQAVTASLMEVLLGRSDKAAAKASDGEQAAATVRTGQVTVLGRPELDYLLDVARGIAARVEEPKHAKKLVDELLNKGEGKKNLAAMRLAAGLDAAMFGRMVTSDILARGDAAVHVAHAFTVHEEATETDYFSAVDDLLASGDDAELGSGHIGTTELTSGLFYGYAVVDAPLLVSNITGAGRADAESFGRDLAAEVVRRLVHVVTKVSPGAKLGSTAPYSYAHLTILEWGGSQPRTLANAFLQPVRWQGDVVRGAYQALARHMSELDAMYGHPPARAVAAIGPVEELRPPLDGAMVGTLDAAADWAHERVLVWD